jgi:hypothetical protein
MDTDEMRDTIWNYLYQARGSKSLEEIAAFVGQEPQVISTAVDHEWFQVTQGKVTIAYAREPVDAGRR